MAIRETIELLFDAQSERATAAIRKVGDESAAAAKKTTTATDKMKGLTKGLDAGGVSAGKFGKLMDVAGLSVAGVGAAAVAFGAKAVSSFERTALSAKKLADTTGLTVEEASRWNEVASDLNVSTDTLTTAFGKFSKGLGANADAFAKYGVEAVRAKDGTVDVQATIMQAIGVLSGMQDGTQRAAAAAAMFGKGWSEASALVTMGADKASAALAKVSNEKVIDDRELKNAEQLRDSLDDLKDKGEDAALAVGGMLAPAVSNMAQALTAAVSGLESVGTAMDGLADKAKKSGASAEVFRGIFGKSAWQIPIDALTDVGRNLGLVGEEAKKTAEATDTLTKSTGFLTDGVRDWIDTSDGHITTTAAEAEAMQDASYKARELRDALAELDKKQQDAMESADDLANAQMGLEGALLDARESGDKYTQTMRDGKASEVDRAKAGLDLRKSITDVGEAAVVAAQKQAAMNGAQFTATDRANAVKAAMADLKAQMPGLAAVIDMVTAALLRIPRNVTSSVHINTVRSDISAGSGYKVAKAAGGPLGAGQVSTINERVSNTGVPETVVLGASGNVIPRPMLPDLGAGGSPIYITVNALSPSQAADAVMEALQQGIRQGGRHRLRQALGVS